MTADRDRRQRADGHLAVEQVVVGLAVDQQGLPVASDVLSGKTGEVLTAVPMLERLRDLGLRNVVWVSDRGHGLGGQPRVGAAGGLDNIIGVRLRAAEDLRRAISRDETPNEPAAEIRVEQAFRTLKHGIGIRPVYHRLEKRIRAHVTLCMLAYPTLSCGPSSWRPG
ncbi:MAG: transposase [bacterium]